MRNLILMVWAPEFLEKQFVNGVYLQSFKGDIADDRRESGQLDILSFQAEDVVSSALNELRNSTLAFVIRPRFCHVVLGKYDQAVSGFARIDFTQCYG